MSTVEEALVDVILDEMEDQRWTGAEMQRRTGIKSRTWQNYFVQRTRVVPIKSVYAIADVLGIPGHELMRRAEERVADLPSRELRRDLKGMSPAGRDAGRRIAREIRDEPEEPAVAERSTPA